jgi:murein L,D-transpeptidase YcbB/YkuD
MENFKFVLFSIIVLGALGFAGYWAFSTIESGSYHVNRERQEQMLKENEELRKENDLLKNELSLLEEEKEEVELQLADNEPANEETEEEKEATPTLKYQSLIDEIQKLVNKGVSLREGSQGTAVGSLQKFLNIYNGTSKRVDNDFGSGTLTIVKDFQKDIGLKDDGVVGPGTMRKMIDWLKKQ